MLNSIFFVFDADMRDRANLIDFSPDSVTLNGTEISFRNAYVDFDFDGQEHCLRLSDVDLEKCPEAAFCTPAQILNLTSMSMSFHDHAAEDMPDLSSVTIRGALCEFSNGSVYKVPDNAVANLDIIQNEPAFSL